MFPPRLAWPGVFVRGVGPHHFSHSLAQRRPQLGSRCLLDSPASIPAGRAQSEGTSRTVQVDKRAFPSRGRVRILKGDSRPQVGQVLRPGRDSSTRAGAANRTEMKEQIRIWLGSTGHFADQLAGLVVRGKEDPAEEVVAQSGR